MCSNDSNDMATASPSVAAPPPTPPPTSVVDTALVNQIILLLEQLRDSANSDVTAIKTAQTMIDRLKRLQGGPLTAALVDEVKEVLYKSTELHGDSQALLEHLRSGSEAPPTTKVSEGKEKSKELLSSPFVLPAVGGLCALVGATIGLVILRKVKQGNADLAKGSSESAPGCKKPPQPPNDARSHEVLSPSHHVRINSAEAFV